jgi:DNA polymerase III delta prime subunit
MNKNCYKWVERYRPDHVKDVILPTAEKKFFENIVKTKQVPNLMLYSARGRGKTSIALALINDLDAQVFKINASMEGKIEVLRDDLSTFARTKNPKKTPKIVFLDEFDMCSAKFQGALRNLIEETAVGCSYIMTCNYQMKVIDALKEGRTMEFDFNFNDPVKQQEMKEQLIARACGILKHEGVEYEEEVVKALVDRFGIAIRDLYSTLQKYYLLYGKIDKGILSFSEVDEKLIELIKAKNLTEARRLIVEKGYSDVDVYKFLYDKYVPVCQKKGSAILTIAQYEGIGATSRLPDIQVAACLISLMGLE